MLGSSATNPPRHHVRRTKLVLYKEIAINLNSTLTRPDSETWVWVTADVVEIEIGLTPSSRLVEDSSIHSICTHNRFCSRRVGGKGSDPRPIRVANLRWPETTELASKRALDPHLVNTKDRSRCKKGTYMVPKSKRFGSILQMLSTSSNMLIAQKGLAREWE